MSTELFDIQAMFQGRLLAGGIDIIDHLTDGGQFLRVYDHAYVARLLEVMGEDFPGVHTLQGDKKFATAARAYIKTHPSTARSIRWLGHDFANWLKQTQPWNRLPVLSDMAAFEWTLGLAFDAPDAPPLGDETLAAVPPEIWPALTFKFHPALNTVGLSFNVVPFQQAVANDQEPDSAPERFPTQETWAVWRDAESLNIYFRPLSADETAGLAALRNEAGFAALCEIIADTGSGVDVSLRAAQLLRHWIEAGWVTGIMAPGHSWPLR